VQIEKKGPSATPNTRPAPKAKGPARQPRQSNPGAQPGGGGPRGGADVTTAGKAPGGVGSPTRPTSGGWEKITGGAKSPATASAPAGGGAEKAHVAAGGSGEKGVPGLEKGGRFVCYHCLHDSGVSVQPQTLKPPLPCSCSAKAAALVLGALQAALELPNFCVVKAIPGGGGGPGRAKLLQPLWGCTGPKGQNSSRHSWGCRLRSLT